MGNKKTYYSAPGIGIPQNYDLPDFLISKVCEFFGLPKEDLIKKTRKTAIRWPRQVGMTLMKKHTRLTLAQIGFKFGGYDHATVMHSVKVVNNAMTTYPKDKKAITLIENFILDASNDVLQQILKVVSREFNVSPVEIVEPKVVTAENVNPICASVWLMQTVNKSSNEQLQKYFNLDKEELKYIATLNADLMFKKKEYYTTLYYLARQIKEVQPEILGNYEG